MRPKGASIPYAAAKAALHHVTQACWRSRLAPAIRVNAVAPGLVETPMARELAGGRLETLEHPIRRCDAPAKPEDIADLVAALLRQRLRYRERSSSPMVG